MPAENTNKRTWGSSAGAGVAVAVLVGVPAYVVLIFFGDDEPVVVGMVAIVTVGTIAIGLGVLAERTTRRFGLGLLCGAVATFLVCAAGFVSSSPISPARSGPSGRRE